MHWSHLRQWLVLPPPVYAGISAARCAITNAYDDNINFISEILSAQYRFCLMVVSWTEIMSARALKAFTKI